jgi:hypothetical protein
MENLIETHHSTQSLQNTQASTSSVIETKPFNDHDHLMQENLLSNFQALSSTSRFQSPTPTMTPQQFKNLIKKTRKKMRSRVTQNSSLSSNGLSTVGLLLNLYFTEAYFSMHLERDNVGEW